MLTVEAYPVMDGLHVRVHGSCNGESHGGARCLGMGLESTVGVDDVEGLGVAACVMLALRGALTAEQRLEELALC